jgi:hypothetical protein
MRILRQVVPSLAVASMTASASSALAFGGTARELERQGTFAITNNAGFGFSQQLNSPSTTFDLRPALDYFVIPNLAVGGAVEFAYSSPAHNPSTTTFTVAPEIGYELALSDTWSFWPQAALSISLPSQGNSYVALELSAPFLVHPAEHFFFGIGPGLQQGLTSNPATVIIGIFRIGGYFDH